MSPNGAIGGEHGPAIPKGWRLENERPAEVKEEKDRPAPGVTVTESILTPAETSPIERNQSRGSIGG